MAIGDELMQNLKDHALIMGADLAKELKGNYAARILGPIAAAALVNLNKKGRGNAGQKKQKED